MTNQLALNVQLRDDATFESFYAADNQHALSAVIEIVQGSNDPFLYLWGQEGVGRTHLLQAACHRASELGVSSVYIPLQAQKTILPSLLQNLEKTHLVCLDDLQYIAGDVRWEEAIFHLFNRIQSEQGSLIIAANAAPMHISISLPDLKSRLSWGISYALQRLTDEQKLNALTLRAKCRGLKFSKTVGRFLLSHCPRNMTELFQTLEKLDEASLLMQRAITIPFVKQVLGF